MAPPTTPPPAAPKPMKTLFENAIDGGAKLVGHGIALPGNGEFLVVETEGLNKHGQKDVAMFLPSKEAETMLPEASRLLNTVAMLAAKGQTVDVGGRTVVKGTLFGEYEGVGYGPGHALPPSRLKVPDADRLIAVPLLAEELSVLERSGLPRVLSRIGMAMRFFPYAPWPVKGRPPAVRTMDIDGSVFSHGMPTAGRFAAALEDNTVVLRPGKQASAMMLDQLRGGRPAVCATPVEAQWCAHALVFMGRDRPPQAITRTPNDRTADLVAIGPVGVSFIALTVAPTHRGGVPLEDGAGVSLGPADARRLCGAFETGTPFTLGDPDDGRMKVRVEPQGGAVTTERPRTDHVFLIATELLSDAAALATSIDISALAKFHDDVVRVLDGAMAKHKVAAGVELRLRYQLEKDRTAPRASILETPDTPKDLVADVGDAVCAIKSPPILAAPVSFELVFIAT